MNTSERYEVTVSSYSLVSTSKSQDRGYFAESFEAAMARAEQEVRNGQQLSGTFERTVTVSGPYRVDRMGRVVEG